MKNDLKEFNNLLKDAIDKNEDIDIQSFLNYSFFTNHDDINNYDDKALKSFLLLTKDKKFLNLLNLKQRYNWSELSFKIIAKTNFSLLDLFENNLSVNRKKPFFITFEKDKNEYSYDFIHKYIIRIASGLYNITPEVKVASFCANSISSACVDLACLFYGIYFSPLNIHFTIDSLEYIFSEINFNVVFADTLERIDLLLKLKEKNHNFLIIDTSNSIYRPNVISLDSFLKDININSSKTLLEEKRKFNISEMTTIMFTSGTTGIPKGVEFSVYNLVTKRFARGAVLPFAGDVVLLCYLPFYHTFGRYLELLGTIYWNGTYVFAPKNDINSLIYFMKEVKPTGFVSIPLRWKELYDRIIDEISLNKYKQNKKDIISNITGGRLCWGLSAAGFLEPKIFKFFNSNNIYLCSGFGMTEATGGISMTTPGKYVQNSVGLPLPGININISAMGELKINGHYVAKYFNDKNYNKINHWISTGDLFTQDNLGNLFIIDRIKDIYKNIKGQTIAPYFIEKKFENVPGIKQVFLVGDMKPFNSLLIVPDYKDDFVKKVKSENKLDEYFAGLVSNVNKSLFTFERIIKYKILEREFSEEKGELTVKGTYKRKKIADNFKSLIDSIYKKSVNEIWIDDISLQIPIWIYKDLGISENGIVFENEHLINRENGIKLTLKKKTNKKLTLANYRNYYVIQVGSFDYLVRDNTLDLSSLVRQPFLWCGNIQLVSFINCKEDFTHIDKNIANQCFPVYFNYGLENIKENHLTPIIKEYNRLFFKLLFGSENEILECLSILDEKLKKTDSQWTDLICRRIESLAFHEKFSIRSKAYKVLLLNQPAIDYNIYLPTFILSGKTFLDKKVIEEILSDKIKGFNLTAFRKRLEAYRSSLNTDSLTLYVKHFRKIFDLLVYFVHKNISAYSQVRAELISWILNKKEEEISIEAQKQFDSLSKWYESKFKLNGFEIDKRNWYKKLVFQDSISNSEIENLKRILAGTTFLKESFMLLFPGTTFNLNSIENKGIFISKISSGYKRFLYKISINTIIKKHYDIVLFIKPGLIKEKIKDTIYLMIQIADNTNGRDVLPQIGNFRSNKGALSISFINDLSVWEKIKYQLSFDENEISKTAMEKFNTLYTRSILSFFIFIIKSNCQVIPGNISPDNTFVSEPFYKQGMGIFSISGWKKFNNFNSIILEIYKNYFIDTFSEYPALKKYLKTVWIFNAVIEGFGYIDGIRKLNDLKIFLNEKEFNEYKELSLCLNDYLGNLNYLFLMNSVVRAAINEYEQWLINDNVNQPKSSRINYVNNLFKLYRIDETDELQRLIFYFETYFKYLDENIKEFFIKILNSYVQLPNQKISKKIELKEIRDLLVDDCDITLFNRMLFPNYTGDINIDFVNYDETNKEILITSHIIDKYRNEYLIRNPVAPYEIGFLQKLFLIDNYPIKLDNDFQYFLICTKDEEQVVGGLCFYFHSAHTVHIAGIQIAREYRSRGLGAKLLNDFIERLHAEGVKEVTTYYILRKFFESFGFKDDPNIGGLIKII